jgi:F0F1-type ATP synthase epsilon subunit
MSEKQKLLDVKLFWSPSLSQEGFQGQALSVTSENPVGKFDILPEHANLVSQVFNYLRIVTKDNKELNYKFKRGVLEVSEDKVRIFLGV